jgi:hypothetical protein
MIAAMTCAELRAIVERRSSQDRLFLSAYLQHLGARYDPAAQAEPAIGNRKISR